MKIQSFILKSGLELIADSAPIKAGHEKNPTGYRLFRPFKVVHFGVPTRTPQGNVMRCMNQIIPLVTSGTQNNLELALEDILVGPFEPTRESEEVYTQQTSGIQLAH